MHYVSGLIRTVLAFPFKWWDLKQETCPLFLHHCLLETKLLHLTFPVRSYTFLWIISPLSASWASSLPICHVTGTYYPHLFPLSRNSFSSHSTICYSPVSLILLCSFAIFYSPHPEFLIISHMFSVCIQERWFEILSQVSICPALYTCSLPSLWPFMQNLSCLWLLKQRTIKSQKMI